MLTTNHLFESFSRIALGGKQAEYAATLLYRHFYPRFVRYFKVSGLRDSVAQEVAQEAMLKLVSGGQEASFENESAFKAWAMRIAHNTMIDGLRKTSQEKMATVEVEDDVLQTILERQIDYHQIDTLMRLCFNKQLIAFENEHPKRAICMHLAVIEGLEIKEVAEVIGRSLVATKEYLSQCKKVLLGYLNVCIED